MNLQQASETDPACLWTERQAVRQEPWDEFFYMRISWRNLSKMIHGSCCWNLAEAFVSFRKLALPRVIERGASLLDLAHHLDCGSR